MGRQLSFQGTLKNGFNQVTEHGARTGQPQPPIGVFRPLQKSIQHLIPEQVTYRNMLRGISPAMMSYAPLPVITGSPGAIPGISVVPREAGICDSSPRCGNLSTVFSPAPPEPFTHLGKYLPGN